MQLVSEHVLIRKLKEAKKNNNLSATDIAKIVKQNGGNLSVTTIKRVFAKGSENQSFSYDYTLLPLVKAMLNKNDTVQEELPDAEMIKGMNAIINTQKDEIERLRKTIQRLESENAYMRERAVFREDLIKQLMEKVL